MMHENVSKAPTPVTPELEKSSFVLFLLLLLRLYLAQAHQKAGVDSAGSQSCRPSGGRRSGVQGKPGLYDTVSTNKHT